MIGQASAWWLILVAPGQLPAHSGPEQGRIMQALPYASEAECRHQEQETRRLTPGPVFWACISDPRWHHGRQAQNMLARQGPGG